MTIAFRSVIHESTLNNKLAAVPTLWSISPPPTTTTTEDAHQHIQWVRGSRHLYACMCMYVCISVRWWLASGMHANAFHCVRVMVTSCVHVRMPYWVVRAMHGWWLMDDCRLWWMAVVMLGSFLWKSDRVNMVDWMNEWMHAWTDCCLCVCVCVCVCGGWVVRSTCLQGGAVYIYK